MTREYQHIIFPDGTYLNAILIKNLPRNRVKIKTSSGDYVVISRDLWKQDDED